MQDHACLHCAFAKGESGRGEVFLHPLQRKPIQFDRVHIDYLGTFMRSVSKNSYLLVLEDGFTKFVICQIHLDDQSEGDRGKTNRHIL